MRQSLILLFIFFTSLSFSQDEQKFSPAQLQRDFDLMVESFLAVHPAPFEFISEAELKKVELTLRKELNKEMTELEFHVLVRKYLRNVGCGHTTALPSEEWYATQKKNLKILPVNFYLIGNEIYVSKAYRGDSVLKAGTRVFSINDIGVDQILEEMRAIQERDGLSLALVNAKIEKLFPTYFLFLYGNHEEYHLSYAKKEGEIGLVSVLGGYPEEEKKEEVKSEPKPVTSLYKMPGAQFYRDTLHPDVGVLDINSFSRKKFKKFYKNVFKEMEEKQIPNLVVDVRGNGGGYFPNGNTLLTYLVPEEFYMTFSRRKNKIKRNKNLKMPFFSKLSQNVFNTIPDKNKADTNRNYQIRYKPNKKTPFTGKVFVLTDGYSFSLAGMTPTKLKHLANATIIGQETGGGENGSYAILTYKLTMPETKVRIILPHYFMDHEVTPEIFGRGLFPDYEINKTLEEKMSPEDEEMQKVFELMNTKQ